MSSLRDQIFAIDDIQKEKVNIPEWNMDVWVKGLTAKEQDDFDISNYEHDEKGNIDLTKPIFANITARIAVKVTCDEKGERIFTDDDADTLGRKSKAALARIYTVSQRLNGVDKDAVKNSLKNSKSAPAEDLPSV